MQGCLHVCVWGGARVRACVSEGRCASSAILQLHRVVACLRIPLLSITHPKERFQEAGLAIALPAYGDDLRDGKAA